MLKWKVWSQIYLCDIIITGPCAHANCLQVRARTPASRAPHVRLTCTTTRMANFIVMALWDEMVAMGLSSQGRSSRKSLAILTSPEKKGEIRDCNTAIYDKKQPKPGTICLQNPASPSQPSAILLFLYEALWYKPRTRRKEIAFTERPKIHSHSQIFRYGRSMFCLPHRPKFSDFFDLCLHWVSVVRVSNYK